MSDGPVDFEQIASDLRRASEEARREADSKPGSCPELTRKADDLLRAAERIEADAQGQFEPLRP